MIHSEISGLESITYESMDALPVLDSFIKETLRLDTLDKGESLSVFVADRALLMLEAVAIRRKALQPYTFSNGGPHVAEGEIACVPAWDLMHDKAVYPDPMEFNGLRFVKPNAPPESEKRNTSFTDANAHYPLWGLGSKAW